MNLCRLPKIFLVGLAVVALVVLTAGNYRSMTPIKAAADNWTPQSEGGCLFGYEAWRPTSLSTDGSGNISQWNDQCSGARHSTQPTGARKPLYASTAGPNGVGTVRINNTTLLPNGSNTYKGLDTTRAHTLCALAKFNNTGQTSSTFLSMHDQSGTHPPGFQHKHSTHKWEFTGDESAWPALYWTQTVDTVVHYRACWTYNGGGLSASNYKLYINGADQGAATTEAGGFDTDSVIGNYANASDANWDLDGDLTAMYLFDHDIGSNGVGHLETYLYRQAGPFASNVLVTSPLRYAMYQRNASTIPIAVSGTYDGTVDAVRAKFVATNGGTSTAWTSMSASAGSWSGTINVGPGLYSLRVEASNSGTLQGYREVTNIGVGDIFLTAGQSNSVNCVEHPTSPTDERVVSRAASTNWRPATDPQDNDSGNACNSGSPWPALGDLIVAQTGYPVGFISLGKGSTSSAQWQPGDASGNYTRFAAGLALVPDDGSGNHGARAVLWHQGESDLATSQATYFANLSAIIAQSRTDIGWTIPWGIARATYTGGTTASAVQAAQAQLATDLTAVFAGADTDSLNSSYRYDNTHFTVAGAATHAALWKAAITSYFGW